MLGAPLEYFTDPFLLVGEGRFCWRHTGVEAGQLATYERRAGRWIAAFRNLAPQVGRGTPFMRRALRLSRQSSFEEAMHAGERLAVEFALGDIPATRLSEVMERELAVLVLMVDAQPGISGAACRLPELDAVLIARGEVAGRRHFDLAHELFHVLTWDAMPPAHYEEASDTGGNRVEQLANNFSSAALMPAGILERYGSWSSLSRDELIRRLNRAAHELQVTSQWRLVALGELSLASRTRAVSRPYLGRDATRALRRGERHRRQPGGTARGGWSRELSLAVAPDDAALRNNGRTVPENAPPPRFSRPFMEVMGLALDRGHVSIRRMAVLLDTTVEDLAQLFGMHGIEQPVDL